MFFSSDTPSSRIAFDCKPLKYPHTGLYSFCDQLTAALAREAFHRKERITAYVPGKETGRWKDQTDYRAARFIDRLYFRLPSSIRVWHCSNQLKSLLPQGNIRVLTTVHDLNYLHEDLTPAQLKRREKKVSAILSRTDCFVAISEFTKQELTTHYDLQGKPVHVIHNGCNLFQGTPGKPGYAPHRKFLFSIGTILPKKNFHVLPCLLEDNDYELLIAGIPSEYSMRIQEEARQWGVADRLVLLGTISEAEKHWYYEHCSAFLFPSIAEGFGLPVVEAMYYGKPLFLSSYTCLPEIGGDCAYYFNRDFDRRQMQQEFRQGMRHFSEGNISPQQMRTRALSFSWENAARKYWELYEELRSTIP